MKPALRIALITAACLTAASTAAAQESWVGQTILVKRLGIRIGVPGGDGKIVYVGELIAPVYKVLADSNGWLQVNDGTGNPGWFQVNDGRGNPGWFPKADAVLLQDAVAFFTGLIRQNGNDGAAYINRATARSLTGDLDNGIRDCDEAMRIRPGSAEVHHIRGELWRIKGDYDKSIADLTAAIRIKPSVSTYWARGCIWELKKDYEKAFADHNEAIRMNPRFADAYFGRGCASQGRKDHGRAIADYDQALRLDPRCMEAYCNRAWIFATCPDANNRNGRKAVESAKQALAIGPKLAPNMDTLAAAHAEAGDFAEAVRWQKLALADPQFKNDEGARQRLELYKKKQPYREQ